MRITQTKYGTMALCVFCITCDAMSLKGYNPSYLSAFSYNSFNQPPNPYSKQKIQSKKAQIDQHGLCYLNP